MPQLHENGARLGRMGDAERFSIRPSYAGPAPISGSMAIGKRGMQTPVACRTALAIDIARAGNADLADSFDAQRVPVRVGLLDQDRFE